MFKQLIKFSPFYAKLLNKNYRQIMKLFCKFLQVVICFLFIKKIDGEDIDYNIILTISNMVNKLNKNLTVFTYVFHFYFKINFLGNRNQ